MSQVDQATCIFCGKDFRPGARGEDIVPNWYAKLIGHQPGTVTVGVFEFTGESAEYTRQSQTAAAKEFRLREVCTECNGGWMSALEQTAKPLLVPLMLGAATALPYGDVVTLAEWAHLKAICWDALQVDPELPTDAASQFRVQRPLGWAVTMAQVESHGPLDISIVRHHALANLPGTPRVSRTTIAFDQLLFQVTVLLDGARLPYALVRELCPPGFIGLWPPVSGDDSRSITWPVETAVTKSDVGQYF